MSSQQPAKKKTIAQLRAEKKQFVQDLIPRQILGFQLADEVESSFRSYMEVACLPGARNNDLNLLVDKADRALQLLGERRNANTDIYRSLLQTKGSIHKRLGQQFLALATYEQAHELFLEAERKGQLTVRDRDIWRCVVRNMGYMYLSSRQLENAKRCFLAPSRGPICRPLPDLRPCKAWPVITRSAKSGRN